MNDVGADGDGEVQVRIRTGLRRVLLYGERAVDVVPTLLRNLDDAGRRAVKDAVFGVAVLRLRLFHRRGLRANDRHGIDGALDDDDLDGLVAALPAEGADVHAGPGDDDSKGDDGDDGDDALMGLVRRRSCPSWLAARLVASLGLDDADRFLAASNRPGPRTLRANTLVNERAGLVAALDAEGIVTTVNAGSPWAVDVVGRANLMGSAAFRAGRFEIQDASSQAVVVAADVRPGDVVVDLCAGRGGKTLALAAALSDRGTLFFDDVDEAALADLRGRLRRLRITCARRGAPADGTADVVVVDAPCTSSGVLRRAPDRRFTLHPDELLALGPVQRALLGRAVTLVRPGGRVVYATCSALDEENGHVVDDVVTGGMPLVEQSRTQLLPHKDGGDGFFIAVFERSRDAR
jgi:16S rRNA (cytosine967-C5)-methyltransferase